MFSFAHMIAVPFVLTPQVNRGVVGLAIEACPDEHQHHERDLVPILHDTPLPTALCELVLDYALLGLPCMVDGGKLATRWMQTRVDQDQMSKQAGTHNHYNTLSKILLSGTESMYSKVAFDTQLVCVLANDELFKKHAPKLAVTLRTQGRFEARLAIILPSVRAPDRLERLFHLLSDFGPLFTPDDYKSKSFEPPLLTDCIALSKEERDAQAVTLGRAAYLIHPKPADFLKQLYVRERASVCQPLTTTTNLSFLNEHGDTEPLPTALSAELESERRQYFEQEAKEYKENYEKGALKELQLRYGNATSTSLFARAFRHNNPDFLRCVLASASGMSLGLKTNDPNGNELMRWDDYKEHPELVSDTFYPSEYFRFIAEITDFNVAMMAPLLKQVTVLLSVEDFEFVMSHATREPNVTPATREFCDNMLRVTSNVYFILWMARRFQLLWRELNFHSHSVLTGNAWRWDVLPVEMEQFLISYIPKELFTYNPWLTTEHHPKDVYLCFDYGHYETPLREGRAIVPNPAEAARRLHLRICEILKHHVERFIVQLQTPQGLLWLSGLAENTVRAVLEEKRFDYKSACENSVYMLRWFVRHPDVFMRRIRSGELNPALILFHGDPDGLMPVLLEVENAVEEEKRVLWSTFCEAVGDEISSSLTWTTRRADSLKDRFYYETLMMASVSRRSSTATTVDTAITTTRKRKDPPVDES